MIKSLSEADHIEVSSAEEARLDLQSIFKEYVRRERELSDEAKERMQREGLSYAMMGRIKSRVAKEWGFPSSDRMMPYLLEQVINMLFHSANSDEIYADDVTLRRTITPILRSHLEVGDDLDREVRSKIKNLTEGTSTFEIEYARVMEQMKRKKGLE